MNKQVNNLPQADNSIPAAFDFNGDQLQVILKNGDPWFLAKDVCEILEIKNFSDAVSTFDSDEKDVIAITDSIGRMQKTPIVNESGLYALIFKSRKSSARAFRKWVTSEVLPAIRRDGGYMLARPEETPEELALRAMKVLQATVDRQKAELSITRPKAVALDILAEKSGSSCITDAAKLLQMQPKELFSYLQSNNWIYRRPGSSEFIAYQAHLVNGDLEHKINTITTNHGERNKYQVRVRTAGLVKLAKLLNPVEG